MGDFFNRAWVEINLENIAHNIKEVRKLISKDVKIMAVVKADAYGHGFLETSRMLLQGGADYLAVAFIDEAKQMRKNGIDAPIIILGYTAPEYAYDMVNLNITQTVYDYNAAKAISEAAVLMGREAKIHIKVDTGMARIGFTVSNEAINTVMSISTLPMLEIEGIYTHFASSEEQDTGFTDYQFDRFIDFCKKLEDIGLQIPIKHACNSSAVIRFPHMHLDMVRPGIMLYGLNPSSDVYAGKVTLKPAMELKAKIVYIKTVPAGTHVSYGRLYTTEKETKIATIPLGYADRCSRVLTGKAKMSTNGELVPVIGRICMDYCMVDVTNIDDIKVGDEVIVFGKKGDSSIFVEDIAENIGTISYEIVSVIGKRIPRVYLRDGKVVSVLNYLV